MRHLLVINPNTSVSAMVQHHVQVDAVTARFVRALYCLRSQLRSGRPCGADCLLRRPRPVGFAVVTGGAKWKPMLKRLAMGLDLHRELIDIHTVAPSGVELANDPQGALELLTQACLQVAAHPEVRSIVLGGAGLAGMAAVVQARVPVPVIDSVIAGTVHALSLDTPPPTHNGFQVQWAHVSPELSILGSR